MDKSYFLEVAEYNIWANNIVMSWLKDISSDQWSQPVVSSFGNLEATTLHIAAAESIWLDRLRKYDSPVWLPHVMNPGKEETLELWTKASKELRDFIQDFDENDLNEQLYFKRINGESSSMSNLHIFAHVFNHSTYHRGQLLTLLRQVGYEKVTGTDMLLFFRKN